MTKREICRTAQTSVEVAAGWQNAERAVGYDSQYASHPGVNPNGIMLAKNHCFNLDTNIVTGIESYRPLVKGYSTSGGGAIKYGLTKDGQNITGDWQTLALPGSNKIVVGTPVSLPSGISVQDVMGQDFGMLVGLTGSSGPARYVDSSALYLRCVMDDSALKQQVLNNLNALRASVNVAPLVYASENEDLVQQQVNNAEAASQYLHHNMTNPPIPYCYGQCGSYYRLEYLRDTALYQMWNEPNTPWTHRYIMQNAPSAVAIAEGWTYGWVYMDFF